MKPKNQTIPAHRSAATPKESEAAKKLGGQPETDQEARDAGLPSATAPDPSEKKQSKPKRGG